MPLPSEINATYSDLDGIYKSIYRIMNPKAKQSEINPVYSLMTATEISNVRVEKMVASFDGDETALDELNYRADLGLISAVILAVSTSNETDFRLSTRNNDFLNADTLALANIVHDYATGKREDVVDRLDAFYAKSFGDNFLAELK